MLRDGINWDRGNNRRCKKKQRCSSVYTPHWNAQVEAEAEVEAWFYKGGRE
jgi:hypothetical protein